MRLKNTLVKLLPRLPGTNATTMQSQVKCKTSHWNCNNFLVFVHLYHHVIYPPPPPVLLIIHFGIATPYVKILVNIGSSNGSAIGYKIRWNHTQNKKIFYRENVVCNLTGILFGPKYIDVQTQFVPTWAVSVDSCMHGGGKTSQEFWDSLVKVLHFLASIKL